MSLMHDSHGMKDVFRVTYEERWATVDSELGGLQAGGTASKIDMFR